MEFANLSETVSYLIYLIFGDFYGSGNWKIGCFMKIVVNRAKESLLVLIMIKLILMKFGFWGKFL